jgi:hypothetical protein
MRTLTALLVLSGALVLGGAAQASDVRLPKTSADELQKICTAAGGSFSPGADRYGCGTDCKGGKGTDCVVTCAPDKRCTGQVIGAHRPRTVEQALAPGKKTPGKNKKKR